MNEIQRLMIDPDTNTQVILVLSDEEWIASQADPQIIRDKIAVKTAAEAARQTDMSDMRTAKAQAALTVIDGHLSAVDSDLINVDAATAGQVRDMVKRILQREKQALQRERVMIKALMRLLE